MIIYWTCNREPGRALGITLIFGEHPALDLMQTYECLVDDARVLKRAECTAALRRKIFLIVNFMKYYFNVVLEVCVE